ncbi:glycosyltransferase family protein [uncultured Maricaulis sp.]|jgi:glutamate-1-semialdehyde 2,1-aminomutase/spore coat polysaccharide biosynthesis protein SpsF|uniref:glycosyltransferase family protein n=1 Tax=uncultured Maricaulis sp. TaxID=174710 RepID=UPI0030DCD670|tara:strand:+ start:64755 stop:65540 length:786 start_codon:yes stop_codon:yes gene_type:complete
MSLAIIVQARFGSTRLPGKILNPLGSKSALVRVLDRCARIAGANHVIAAVPDTDADDVVAEAARAAGYAVSRGSEHDVLSRYAKAARDCGAEYIMRVTSDCPFIDPQICGRVIELLHETHADYASNSMPALFPHGLDCEVFPSVLLYRADRLAREPGDREHVTPWLRQNPHLHHASLSGPGQGLERLRWTLDYAEDLQFFQAVYDELGEAAATASAAELAALCLRRPDLVAINAGRIDECRLENSQQAEIISAPFALREAA